MVEHLQYFALTFVPLFIVIDALGNLPFIIVRFMSLGGLRAVSRVFSLLLTAIAVSMIIRGLDLAGIISAPG